MALREPHDILHKGQSLDRILWAHSHWVLNEKEGAVRADLAGAKLFSVRLRNTVLPYADLAKADLHRADLQRANLTQAEMTEADLRETDLRGANLQGAALSRAQLHRADLRGANLRNAVLDGADLIGTNLHGAQLQGASLAGARLYRADLSGADLTEARLAETEIVETRLCTARLHHTVLASAKLIATDLRGARLEAVDFTSARLEQSWLGHTHVAQCELGRIIGLETARHFGPTWLDAKTLALSKNLPAAFLYGAGVAAPGKAGAPAPVADERTTQICFLAHSPRDTEFAERLRTDLMANGVRCWFLPEDVTWDFVELGRPAYDRLVLVCSRQSLHSRGVLHEAQHALDREEAEKAAVLFPVRTDDYLEEWQDEKKERLMAKPVGDFRNWKDHDLYTAALQRLLEGLRSSSA